MVSHALVCVCVHTRARARAVPCDCITCAALCPWLQPMQDSSITPLPNFPDDLCRFLLGLRCLLFVADSWALTFTRSVPSEFSAHTAASAHSEHVFREGHRRSGLCEQAFLPADHLHRLTFNLRSLEGGF